MNRPLIARLAAALLVVALFAVPSQALAGKHHGHHHKHKTFVVCKHGCKYRTIQKAVNKSRRHDTVKIKPGHYSEGVYFKGSKHNGLKIMGARHNAKKVVLNGKHKLSNGIDAVDVKNLKLKNMWAKNYEANGFFVHDFNPGDDKPNKSIKCRNYLMKNLLASFNRGYGLYAFGCIGGDMSHSTGWGSGDSAFYIGATPPQVHPKKSVLDHLDGHENVLGYSGTNSRYVNIRKSSFYNNGIGIVPNTLDSEPYQPSAKGKIKDNDIFWNNFNYFLPNSRVKTVSDGIGELGGLPVQFPIGTGIVLLGADGWKVKNNRIFGNYKWGAVSVANPTIDDGSGNTITVFSENNHLAKNEMGRGGSDSNGYDFFADGGGDGNCWSGNDSSTFDSSHGSVSESELYPACPAAPGSGGSTGFDSGQFGEIGGYAITDPSENMECTWDQHAHPGFKNYKPLDVTPGPDCPAAR